MPRARAFPEGWGLAGDQLGLDRGAAADAAADHRQPANRGCVGRAGAPAWFSFGYVSLFSMLIGFVFWYRGLVQGGIAAVGQLQLLQPFMGLGLAALLLHEHVSWMMLVVTLGAVMCVAGARKYAH